MKFIVDMPDELIPQKQEIKSIDLYFIDGKLCGCTYPFEVQEPCDDAISREAAENLLRCGCGYEIYNLPSVQPKQNKTLLPKDDSIHTIEDLVRWADEHDIDIKLKPKQSTGHWDYVQYDGNPNIGNWHCSECRAIVNYEPTYNWEKGPYYKFCPNCGAKMGDED